MVAHLATIDLTVITLAIVYLTVVHSTGRASRISRGFGAAISNIATGTARGRTKFAPAAVIAVGTVLR
jgi:hypothetical protein